MRGWIVYWKNNWKQMRRELTCLFAILTLAALCQIGKDTYYAKQDSVPVMAAADVGEKRVCLTFDDGPNPDHTPRLLDGLKKRGVRATFFLIGREAALYPDLVRRMYEEGHLIGNHSYEHVNLCNLSDEAAIEQVNRTNEVLEELTGETPLFIRPPFGCWKPKLDYETRMIEVLWDVDPRDWATGNTDAVIERIVENVKEEDIILLHDASQSSVDAAFAVVDILTARGYTFVTVEELLME